MRENSPTSSVRWGSKSFEWPYFLAFRLVSLLPFRWFFISLLPFRRHLLKKERGRFEIFGPVTIRMS